MGFFWDLLQQSQISDNQAEARNLRARVRRLESQLQETRALLRRVIERLEAQQGVDLDGDGKVG